MRQPWADSAGREAKRAAARKLSLCSGLVLALAAAHAPALGGQRLELYFGEARTEPSTVHWEAPSGDALTAYGVRWKDASWTPPLYYGLRWTFPRGRWAWGFDFTHAKMFSSPAQHVEIQGTQGGQPLAGEARLEDLFPHLAFSHGHNLLAVVVERTFGSSERWRPHLLAGAGVAIPHVEVEGPGGRTERYELAGVAWEVGLGLRARWGARWSLLLEYRETRARFGVDLAGGERLRLEPRTRHLVAGLGRRFGR